MMEKLFGILPDFMQKKLAIRVVYTAGSFITARIVAFLTGDYLGKVLGELVEGAGHIGIGLQIKVVSINQSVLQAAITGALMMVGEYFIEKIHEKSVLPVVAPEAHEAAQEAVAQNPQGGQK